MTEDESDRGGERLIIAVSLSHLLINVFSVWAAAFVTPLVSEYTVVHTCYTLYLENIKIDYNIVHTTTLCVFDTHIFCGGSLFASQIWSEYHLPITVMYRSVNI